MIDDFTNIDKNGKNIRNVFYEEKVKNSDYQIIGYFGIDGVLIRYLVKKIKLKKIWRIIKFIEFN